MQGKAKILWAGLNFSIGDAGGLAARDLLGVATALGAVGRLR
jgi:hypothetical protein